MVGSVGRERHKWLERGILNGWVCRERGGFRIALQRPSTVKKRFWSVTPSCRRVYRYGRKFHGDLFSWFSWFRKNKGIYIVYTYFHKKP
jgi:hypothetical protein